MKSNCNIIDTSWSRNRSEDLANSGQLVQMNDKQVQIPVVAWTASPVHAKMLTTNK